MLSQKTKYSIRALQHLTDFYGQGNIKLREIATKQNIPNKFLTVILSELTREGIVISQRGTDGGYQLALAPIDISYGDIVRITRGSVALVPCASRFAYEKCVNCVNENECRLRILMLRIRDQTALILDNISFAEKFDVDSPEWLETLSVEIDKQ
jgi:Rrf2 family protein